MELFQSSNASCPPESWTTAAAEGKRPAIALGKTMRFAAILTLFLSAGAALSATDFREPIHAYDPLDRAIAQPAVFADSAGELQYVNYAFNQSDYQRFLLSAHATVMPLTFPDVAALSLSFGSYLTGGPANIDPKPTAVGFLLNVVQFEYSLRGSLACGPVNCLFGYGRRSQHHLRSGLLDTGVDILSFGVSLPPGPLGSAGGNRPIIGSGFLVVRSTELYDFWESSLPEPRSRWTAELRTRFGIPLGSSHTRRAGTAAGKSGGAPGTAEALAEPPHCRTGACYLLFADASAKLLMLRDGTADLEWTAELGAERFVGNTLVSFFLFGHQSNDTRMSEDGPTPALLLGIGGRALVAPSRRW